MMSWRYRVIKRMCSTPDGSTEPQYTIHEFYPIREGSDEGAISVNPMYPCGETIKELEHDLKYMKQALKEPALDWESFHDDEFDDKDL